MIYVMIYIYDVMIIVYWTVFTVYPSYIDYLIYPYVYTLFIPIFLYLYNPLYIPLYPALLDTIEEVAKQEDGTSTSSASPPRRRSSHPPPRPPRPSPSFESALRHRCRL